MSDAVRRAPGHASHHQSFVHADVLYVGEAAGTYLDLRAEGFVTAEPEAGGGAGSGTEPGAGYYLRPATPPRFLREVVTASLERLLAIAPEPRRIAFAHHGIHAGDARVLLARARDRLLVWVDAAREEAKDHLVRRDADGTEAAPASLSDPDFDAFAERTMKRLLAVDPHFARLPQLPADIQERERQFTR